MSLHNDPWPTSLLSKPLCLISLSLQVCVFTLCTLSDWFRWLHDVFVSMIIGMMGWTLGVVEGRFWGECQDVSLEQKTGNTRINLDSDENYSWLFMLVSTPQCSMMDAVFWICTYQYTCLKHWQLSLVYWIQCLSCLNKRFYNHQ